MAIRASRRWRGRSRPHARTETAKLSSPIPELVYRGAFQKLGEERSFDSVSRLRAALIVLPIDEPYPVCPLVSPTLTALLVFSNRHHPEDKQSATRSQDHNAVCGRRESLRSPRSPIPCARQ